MKIIIAGAGEVGFHLAKLLSYESQDITLIDSEKESLAYADTHLDIRVLKGDATSIAVLRDAQVDKSDLVIGVTSSETTNITFACWQSNSVVNVPLQGFRIPNSYTTKNYCDFPIWESTS